MSSSLRRGALSAAAIVLSIASLTACGAGNNAQTLEIKPDNAAVTVGDIQAQNVVVITQAESDASGPAVVSATLFNNGSTDQTLQSVELDGAGSLELTPAEGEDLVVPAHGSLTLGGKGNASAVLAGGREALRDGDAQKVTFTFSETGAVSLEAFVVPASGYYASWGPSALPESPAATASASPESTDSASPDADASASAPASSPAGDATASQSAE